MVLYVYSLQTLSDNQEEFLICLDEKQNLFCKKNLIVTTKNLKTIKLVHWLGFNESIEYSFPDVIKIIDYCIIDENIDLRNIINKTLHAKIAMEYINILLLKSSK